MAEPFNNIRSKLSRAIAAYLIDAGAGTEADTLPHTSVANTAYPNTVVRATLSKPEVPMSGMRRVTVHISIKGSATNVPKESNPQKARVQFDQRVADVCDALMQTDDDETYRATARLITIAGRDLATPADATPEAAQAAANNADMEDFTCQGWYDGGEGDGAADAEGCSWEEILIFEALVSPSDTD
jgi:hypothetical protein